MASELRVTTIANNAGSESVDTTYVVNGSLKSWANFTQSSTHTVNDSLNVGSISDNGAGDSTLNFTNNMSNSNFTATSSSMNAGTKFQYHDSDASSGVVVRSRDVDGGGSEDLNEGATQVAGDLA